MRPLSIVAGAVCLLCVSADAAGAAPPLQADAAETTPTGATFKAPKNWSVAQVPGAISLVPPEGDFRLAVVEGGQAGNAADAVRAAWQLFDASEHHALEDTAPRAAKDGWDEAALFEYNTSPEEHLSITAEALRHGRDWTVLIAKGSQSTYEKRLAAVALVAGSLRAPGNQRENFAGRTPHPLDAARIGQLQMFLMDGMAKLRVPGVAVALIDHGKLVYEGGLGVRELGRPEPVDAHTRFMIASNTKGLTTLLLARLVDQGKLGWDQKVTDVYPDFRLGSPATTKQVLIRHLICACTGVPRRDFEVLFDTSAQTPASDTFKQLADTEPTSGFGEMFQYSNVMAAAAGYVGGHIAHPDRELGAAYAAAMQEQVFGPLGMTETGFDYAQALAADHASPHGDTIDGQAVVASMDMNYTFLPVAPAGAAWSSVHDLIKYLQDELTQGVLPDGTAFVSKQNLLMRRRPNVSIGEDVTYGMGLATDTRYGVTEVHHGGDLIGFHSDVIAITDAQVGAVILTNGDNGYELRGPFARRLLELLYDGKPQAAKELDAAASGINAEWAGERPHLSMPPDAAEVSHLAGYYTNPSLGSIRVKHDGSGVVFDFGSWNSPVATRKNDDGTVAFVTTAPGEIGYPFTVTKSGGKRALIIRDGQHAYTYVES